MDSLRIVLKPGEFDVKKKGFNFLLYHIFVLQVKMFPFKINN